MTALARINGSKIRQARLKAGMTQTQLARAVNTTERNIARWETSANQPRVSSVAAIAEATGQSIDFFLTPNGDSEDDEETDLPAAFDAMLRSYLRRLIREEVRA